MKERTITIAEAQKLLKNLSEQVSEETLVIARDGQPLLTLMPYQTHQALLANIESLQTVLEIMLGGEKTETQRPPRPALVDEPLDKSISWEEFQKEVGWG